MNTPDPDQTGADGDATHEDILDKHDDAVLAADATGMLAGERFITEAEIEQALDKGDPA